MCCPLSLEEEERERERERETDVTRLHRTSGRPNGNRTRLERELQTQLDDKAGT